MIEGGRVVASVMDRERDAVPGKHSFACTPVVLSKMQGKGVGVLCWIEMN
jgi:hypothetical protein